MMRILCKLAVLLSLLAVSVKSEQIPMNPPFQSYVPESSSPSLFDRITVQTRASIFSDYLRSIPDLSSRLSSDYAKSTVLVPTNKAVLALARKPHMGPSNSSGTHGEIEISDEEKDRSRRENVENWLSAHIIPQYPIDLSSDAEFPTLHDGVTIHFSEAKNGKEDWQGYVLDPEITILQRTEGSNGVFYLLDGTVTF